MNVLVTGGAGFIGKALVERLVAAGHQVTVVDNLSFGRRSHVPDGVTLVELDLGLADPGEIAAVVAEVRPQAVFHLAAIHFIPYCMEHPDEAFRSNVTATNNLVSALQAHPVEALVFTSTMDVYEAADVVHAETHKPQPANIYGLTKYLSEVAVEYAARIEACRSATAFRLANVYGPHETNPHLIPDAIRKIGAGGDNEIRMGYLGAQRDFVYVDDVAAALHMAAERARPGFARYNVGTGVPRPVRDILHTIQHLMGDERSIVEDERQFRKFDRPSLTPDITAITTDLGWSPAMSLEDGLRTTVESETKR